MEKTPKTSNQQNVASNFRLLPLTIAGLLCFVIAVSSGFAAWYFISMKSPLNKFEVKIDRPAVAPSPTPSIAKTVLIEPTPLASIEPSQIPEDIESSSLTGIKALAGEVTIEGGEIALGGGETNLPIQRKFVQSFVIGETEVTNAQFREFLQENPASSVQKKTIPEGKDDEPVTDVTWNDVDQFCKWLSQKLNAEVRLPTEAEWELAARGSKGFKYPWGNEWRDDAAEFKEKNGKVRPVKSFSSNKSPFGAYDMAGNVWEWTRDERRDETGRIVKYDGPKQEFKDEPFYVLKGGAAFEEKKNISAQARTFLPKSTRLPYVGFRYVIVRKS